jgi:hypothetical protein
VRRLLKKRGIYFYNTTGSHEVLATGLRVFPYGLRVINFLVVSDSPLRYSRERLLAKLQEYRIDGKLVFDAADPKSEKPIQEYLRLADSISAARKDSRRPNR